MEPFEGGRRGFGRSLNALMRRLRAKRVEGSGEGEERRRRGVSAARRRRRIEVGPRLVVMTCRSERRRPVIGRHGRCGA